MGWPTADKVWVLSLLKPVRVPIAENDLIQG
jgi:hypothetical protein